MTECIEDRETNWEKLEALGEGEGEVYTSIDNYSEEDINSITLNRLLKKESSK